MNILICKAQVPFVYGGAEVFAEELNNKLNSKGHNSAIVQLPYVPYPPENIFRNIMSWRMLDLSVSHGVKIDMVICLQFPSYAVKHDNKIIWLLHQHREAYELLNTKYSPYMDMGTEERDRILRQIKYIDNRTINEAKKVFVQSQNVANRLKKFNNIKSTVVNLPLLGENNFHNNLYGDYILCSGRLHEIKRVEIMINAMRFVKSSVRFIIAGKGPREDYLRKLVQRHNLGEKVIFKGFVTSEELINLYSDALAIYYGPFDEDYGYVTVEAFMSKKPVITLSDSGGPLEFVEDNISGFVCQKNYRAISKKIDYLFENKDVCYKMGNAGYNKVKDITWDNALNQILE